MVPELRQLLRDCLAGKRVAQKKLYDRFSPLLFGIIRRYMPGQAAAGEVLNDSFYKIFSKLDTYQFTGSFEGWMRRIVVHTITDHFRKTSRIPHMDSTDLVEVNVQVMQDAISRIHYKELLRLIHALPDTQRTVFNLFVFEQFSHKEIGDQLGLSENNSRWYLNDARRRLKEKITSMMK